MLDVLEPFEVADCHSTAVAEHIWQEAHSLLEQDLLSLAGGGTVSGLHNQLAAETVGVVDVDRLLKGSRDENIAA